MISLFMATLRSLDVLHRASYPMSVKIRLAVTYLRMTCKLAFLDPFLHFTRETFLGYQVHCCSYKVLHMLFSEIFMLEEYFFESATRGPLIMDCGANIGVATLYFKWRYPEARVCAFEPNASAFELLARNVTQNHLENVEVWNAALSGEGGEVLFYSDKLAGVTASLHPNSPACDSTTVRALQLSPFIDSREIDFIKMDIEGAEQEVIVEVSRSGRLRNIKQLAIEYHQLPGEKCNMSTLLAELEDSGFNYRVRASLPSKCSASQDIMVYAGRL